MRFSDRCYFSDERRSRKVAKFLRQLTVLGWFAPQLCSKIFKAWRNRGEALLDFSAISQGEGQGAGEELSVAGI
jgi:hypothetical protein